MMNTLIFDSIFKNEIQDLINLKRAQGFKYAAEEFALKRIDKYFVDKKQGWAYCTQSHTSNHCPHNRGNPSNLGTLLVYPDLIRLSIIFIVNR